MARRVGSAKAMKTRSATASMSAGIEDVSRRRGSGQFTQLARPPLGVAVERLAVKVLWQLGKTGLDHPQQRAVTGRFERELDIGTARIVLRQFVQRQVNPNSLGSSTRSTRMSTVAPPAHLMRPAPPGGRSILTSSPNQAPRPSAVVSAAHTLSGG
jgi:hypothetical protein